MFVKGYIPWNKGTHVGGGYRGINSGCFKKGIVPWNKGKKMWVGKKISRKIKEENNPSWKGDDVGYTALHQWVYKNLGQPNYCEHCKSTVELAYHWANKSHEYKRDVSDWMRLCVKCHFKYDREFNKD